MAMATLKLPTTYTVCVSPRERLLAALGRSVVVANIESRKRIGSWRALSHPSEAAFSPDESLLAVKSTWGEVVVIEPETGVERARWRPKKQDEGSSIHFSRCGGYLVDGCWSGHIRLRQVNSMEVVSEFTYQGQMIQDISKSANGGLWLVAHVPKTPVGAQRGDQAYLTLWSWPLRSPERRIELGVDSLYAAELAPSEEYIGVVGYSNATKRTELRVLSLDGKVLSALAVETGGTGCSLRWSPDSRLIGVVIAGAFQVFQVPELTALESISDQYPSDLAFIRGGAEVILGTWSGGRIQALSNREL